MIPVLKVATGVLCMLGLCACDPASKATSAQPPAPWPDLPSAPESQTRAASADATEVGPARVATARSSKRHGVTAGPALAAPPHPKEVELRIAAVGDLMAQTPLVNVNGSDARRWQASYGALAPYLKGSHLAFGNLETPITSPCWDEARRTKNRLAPFPVFHAPEAMVRGLKSVGFSLLSVANNHAFDQGPDGLRATLAALKRARIRVTGSGPLGGPMLTIIKHQGFSVGVAAFAAFTNIKMWDWKLETHWFNYMNENNDSHVASALRLVSRWRNQVDLLILSLHWGVEYSNWPQRRQRVVAARLLQGGADIILGHHPHVLQPAAFYNTRRGTRTFVIYSLGNSLSAMGITTLAHAGKEVAARSDSILLNLRVVLSRTSPPRIHASYVPFFSLCEPRPGGVACRLINLLDPHTTRKVGTAARHDDTQARGLARRLRAITKIYAKLPLTPF